MPSAAASAGFDSLHEELVSDQDPRVQCKLCRWVKSQKPAVQEEWVAAIVDYSYTGPSLYRALTRPPRNATLTLNSVENCRKLGHLGAPINRPDYVVARTKKS